MKYPLAFVEPQFYEGLGMLDLLGLSHQDALEHFGDISHVEEVVESRWNRKHIFVELAEHVDGRCYCNVATLLHSVAEEILFQELLDHRIKNGGQDFLRSIWDVDDVKMSHEPRRQACSSTSRRSSCTNDFEIVDSLLEEIGPVINYVAVQK